MKKLGTLIPALLTASAMDAHNTFDKPEVVKPVALKNLRVRNGAVLLDMPPKSIFVLSETGK